MTPADRSHLRQILATFDEAGLVALSNKGLVRRAQKDFEAGGLTLEETDSSVLVRGPDWTVTMPATGPGDATDDTPASGITRQILTATIFLRCQWCGDASSNPSEPDQKAAEQVSTVADFETANPRDDHGTTRGTDEAAVNPQLDLAIQALEQMTYDDFAKWAGKSIVLDSLAIAQSGTAIDIERGFGLIVRFPQHETEVRIVPKPWGRGVAALLDQFLTNAPRAFRRQWVVAAVLGLRKDRGLPEIVPESAKVRDALENLKGRAQVLSTASQLLDGLTRTGLAHPSQRMVQRLFTSSVSATGCHLPRLSRQLRSMADEVALILSRDARGNSERLFDQLGLTQALISALQLSGAQPSIDLVGRHRSEYEETGDLLLSGAGAFPWRTASGFEGVTALFWDAQRERFWTWTESRPEDGPGRFNRDDVYKVIAPWRGGPAVSELCRRSFVLRNARANPQGRLSASQQSTVELLPGSTWPPQSFAGREFRDWVTLAEYARQVQPIGLRVPDPLQRIVVIRPREWGPRTFDETAQRLIWTVLDKNFVPLQVVVPWEEVNEASIEFLESVKADRDQITGLIGRLDLRITGLILEPIAVLSEGTPAGDRLLNPAFDRPRIESKQASLLQRLRDKFGRGKIHSATTVDDDQTLALDDASFPPGIERSLADLEGRLLRLAETGLHDLDDLHRKQLGELARRMARSGLSALADGVDQLCQRTTPTALLHCRYLCRLHREAASAFD